MADEPRVDRPPSSILEASGAALGAPSRWFEWRYAAAGLGWGALVGAATGVLLALIMAFGSLASEGGRLLHWLSWPLLLTIVGALWGAVLGGVIGAVSGLVSAALLPHARSERSRWWIAFVVPAVVALAVLLALQAWDRAQGVVNAGPAQPWVVVNLLPVLALGWLMARTSANVHAHRVRLGLML